MKRGWLSGLMGLGLSAIVLAAPEKRPNVLVILADDLGYHDLGFQGSTTIKTSNLDWLASQGVRFTDAHVTGSTCSPSRAGFITGRYPHRFGYEANCPPKDKGLDVNERTIGQAFQEAGYRTAVFGKWHLGDLPERYPTVRGFDVFYGLREGGRSYWYNKKDDRPGSARAAEHNGKLVKFDGHFTDWLGENAIHFMKETKKPFFVYLSFTAPHGPLQSKKEDMKAVGLPRNRYAGLIYGMDRNVGYVIEALKKSRKLDNTMIWFFSDNGGIVRQSSNAPLGGIKGTFFEGGHRVPFVLYWKGHLTAGTVYNKMVSSMDVFPTSLTAAGGSLKQERPLDGVDLIPYLTGKKKGAPHETLCWRKCPIATIRHGDWKLIRVDDYGSALYNLKDDLGEQHDLSKKMPEKTAQLEKELKTWESTKKKALWREQKRWQTWRYNYHISWFKTGKPPGKKK